MTEREPLTPTAAAIRLGITPDAVRARLRRGTLAGERVAGDWRVFLPADTTPRADQHDTDTTPRDPQHDADAVSTALLLAAKDEAIARLDADVAFLREELAHRTEEVHRRDVLLRQALERIPQPAALPTGESGAQEAHSASPGRPGATEGAKGTPDASAPAGGGRRPWWKRLLGLS